MTAEPATDPWDEYAAAARRLDGVRRAAAEAVTERAETSRLAQAEIAALRPRLDLQRARLQRDIGVPAAELTPSPEDRAGAEAAVADNILVALREARSTTDAADSAAAPTSRTAAWKRNLLVYGPFALVVLVAQIALSAAADNHARLGYALLCSLTLPVVAWGLGWVGIGVAFGGSDRKLDRTPVLGLAVCVAPVLITCAGVGALSLFR